MKVLLLALICLTLPCVIAAPIVENTGNITVHGAHDGTITVTFNSDGGGGESGAGGGEEGGEANVCLAPNPSTSHQYDTMVAGNQYTIRSHTEQFLIDTVSFAVTEDITDTSTVTLTHVLYIECETIPSLSTELDAVGYERIDYIGILPDQIADVEINFTVKLEDLDGADPASVRLLRYVDSNWVELPTTYLDSSILFAYYTVESPGLSMFAIATPAQESSGDDDPAPDTGDDPSDDQITGDVTGGPQDQNQTGNTSGTTEHVPVDSSKTKRRGFSWISILIVVVIGGALGAYYYIENRKKTQPGKTDVAVPEEKPVEAMMGIADIPDEALQDPVDQLRTYVDRELRQGFPREQIADKLREHGWPEDVVNNVLNEFSTNYLADRGMEPHDDHQKLLAFLQEKLDLGYNEQTIKDSLVKIGWDAKVIDDLFAELHEGGGKYTESSLSKLRAFIQTEGARGKRRDEIKASLINAGWDEELVEKELQ